MSNKFGMFIHWGIFALTKQQDQAFVRFKMPRDEYEALAKEFNPVDYDPEKWVLEAKNAGMEYICFTTKHHDGFCMWDTKYTDYNIMNTPYGKDVLKMLSDACAKHGLKLSLYYSNPDWHYEYGYNPNSTHQWAAVQTEKVDLEAYKQYIKNQITELLSNYGEIYTLFWDIPPKVEDKSINELVRKLQPNILINDRGFELGDFSTPEREYQTTGATRFTRMTEACNSFDVQSWGYRENSDYYSLRFLTSAIDKIMAMGGNYLLNVGPTPEGTIPPEQLARLKKVGDWYNRMSGCLTGHVEETANISVYRDNPCVINNKNGKTYLHFYDGTRATAISLKSYPGLPKKATMLNNKKALPFEITLLPEYFDGKTGACDGEYLHIRGIDVDELSNEPIVIEIEW